MVDRVIAQSRSVPGRKLAVPVLSAEERSDLRELMTECVLDDYPSARAFLDRLLGAKP